jgi:hypothetical protein
MGEQVSGRARIGQRASMGARRWWVFGFTARADFSGVGSYRDGLVRVQKRSSNPYPIENRCMLIHYY